MISDESPESTRTERYEEASLLLSLTQWDTFELFLAGNNNTISVLRAVENCRQGTEDEVRLEQCNGFGFVTVVSARLDVKARASKALDCSSNKLENLRVFTFTKSIAVVVPDTAPYGFTRLMVAIINEYRPGICAMSLGSTKMVCSSSETPSVSFPFHRNGGCYPA